MVPETSTETQALPYVKYVRCRELSPSAPCNSFQILWLLTTQYDTAVSAFLSCFLNIFAIGNNIPIRLIRKYLIYPIFLLMSKTDSESRVSNAFGGFPYGCTCLPTKIWKLWVKLFYFWFLQEHVFKQATSNSLWTWERQIKSIKKT